MTDGADEISEDEACIVPHDPLMKRFVGYLCKRHYHRMAEVLDQIMELFALLETEPTTGISGDGRSGKQVHAPANLRLDVAALTDRRARELGDDGEIPDVVGKLAEWAHMVSEERQPDLVLRGPLGGDLDTVRAALDLTLSRSVTLLRRERHWIAQQAWCDDYLADLDSIHRHLASGARATMWPESIGRCPNCSTPLHNTIGIDQVTCRRCGSVWDGVNLVRLRLILEQDKTA